MVGDASVVRLIERAGRADARHLPGRAAAGSDGPGSVQVSVLNGTGGTDEGRNTGDALRRAGFNVADGG